MKKIIFIMITLLIMATITACVKPESNIKTNDTISPPSADLPEKFPPDLAEKSSAVVAVHGKGTNIEKLDKYIEDFRNKNLKPGDSIRIVTYTTEGDAIISTLQLQDKVLKIIVDNTRDKFAGSDDKKKRVYTASDIKISFRDNYKTYDAVLVKGGQLLPLVFVSVR